MKFHTTFNNSSLQRQNLQKSNLFHQILIKKNEIGQTVSWRLASCQNKPTIQSFFFIYEDSIISSRNKNYRQACSRKICKLYAQINVKFRRSTFKQFVNKNPSPESYSFLI